MQAFWIFILLFYYVYHIFILCPFYAVHLCSIYLQYFIFYFYTFFILIIWYCDFRFSCYVQQQQNRHTDRHGKVYVVVSPCHTYTHSLSLSTIHTHMSCFFGIHAWWHAILSYLIFNMILMGTLVQYCLFCVCASMWVSFG